MLTFEVKKDQLSGYTLFISNGVTILDFYINDLVIKPEVMIAYDIVNQYVSTISKEKKKLLFSLYEEVYNSNNSYCDILSKEHREKLEEYLKIAFDCLDLNNINNFLTNHQHLIVFPPDISEVFIYDQDMSVTEDKTYIKKEYLELIGLVVLIRALVPIFVNYFIYNKNATKQYIYVTFLLFTKTALFESKEYNKLYTYVKSIQESFSESSSDKYEQYIINKGLSSDDVIDTIIAEILLNKLLFIDTLDPKNKIISFIYQTIKVKSKSSMSDGNIIRAKKNNVDGTLEDMSYFEDYRKSSNIAIGTVAELQYASGLFDQMLYALNVREYFNYDIYQNELSRSSILKDKKIEQIQIYMLGLFINEYLDPRSLFYIEKLRLIELLTFARVCLWNMDCKFISLFLTSYKSENNSQLFSSSKMSLSKNIKESLKEYYKFYMYESEKQSLIESSITQLCENIIEYQWVPTGSIEDITNYNESKNYSILNIPSRLADTIAEFMIRINSLKKS